MGGTMMDLEEAKAEADVLALRDAGARGNPRQFTVVRFAHGGYAVFDRETAWRVCEDDPKLGKAVYTTEAK